MVELKRDIHFSSLFVWLILILPVLMYGFIISHYFWLLPCHRDAVEYLAPAIFGTSWGGYYPWLDRISLAIGLRIWLLVFSLSPKDVVPWFMLSVNLTMMIVSIVWAVRRGGFLAGLMVGVFFNVSYLFLLYGSIVYPDQLLTLFTFLAYIAFSEAKRFNVEEKRKQQLLIVTSGFFTAAACFSKVSGIVIAVFLLGMLLWAKEWKKALWFSVGVVSGAVLILGLYAWLYHPESLVYTIKQFFLSNISENLEVINKYYVSYLNVVLDMLYFPFLSLLVLNGAYRKEETRNLFLLAWGYIFWMYGFVAFAGAGNGPHARYILPAYLCTIVGASIYLAEEYQKEQQLPSKIFLISMSVIGLSLAFLGLWIGRQFDPQEYTPTKFPYYIKWLYVLGPFVLVFSLLLFEWLKKKAAFWVFLLASALWISAYDGGWALSYHKQLSFYCSDMFSAAETLSNVPAKEFGVYVDSFKQLEHPERILWIYKYFIDTKYPRRTDFQALVEYNRQIKQGIHYIAGEAKLNFVPGNMIITDQENVVKRVYPQARKIKVVYWKNEELSVLQWK